MAHLFSQLLPTIVIGIVAVALLLRRTLGTQRVHVPMLIVVPVFIIVLAVWYVVSPPAGAQRIAPQPSSLLLVSITVGAVAGTLLGYLRGRHSHVTLGPTPNTILVKGSALLVAILIGAFVLRFALRVVIPTDPAAAIAIGDGTLVFAAFSVAVARAMLFVAWRRLVATAALSARS
jgi:hypothetical protein